MIDEVKTRMGAASASIVSEYRGLTVAEMAELRAALAAAGGDYKIFKNTLVRRAIDGGEYQPLSEYLSGPSALTFVEGDISAVAKALRDFSRANPLLVIKGGLADGSLLSPADLAALADLPPREVLLARLAGALAAPMQQMAGLLQALPRTSPTGSRRCGTSARPTGGETAAAQRRSRPRRHRPRRPRQQPRRRRAPAEEAARRHRPRRLRRRNRWRPPGRRMAAPRRRPPPKRPPSRPERTPEPDGPTDRNDPRPTTRQTETQDRRKERKARRWQP